jgi:hypothetical protein
MEREIQRYTESIKEIRQYNVSKVFENVGKESVKRRKKSEE